MRRALTRVAAALSSLLGAAAVPALANGAQVRIDPNFPPLYQTNPHDWGRRVVPVQPGVRYRVVPQRYVQRPVVACDAYGRCWQQLPGQAVYGGYPYGTQGYAAPLTTRPPGWADDLPRRAQQPDRFVRPEAGVVCDQASNICYKRGQIDKTETRDHFGDRAADRADDVRDDFGTSRLFVPERGVTCSQSRQVCFDDGRPDSSLTRRYFGSRAADAVD